MYTIFLLSATSDIIITSLHPFNDIIMLPMLLSFMIPHALQLFHGKVEKKIRKRNLKRTPEPNLRVKN